MGPDEHCAGAVHEVVDGLARGGLIAVVAVKPGGEVTSVSAVESQAVDVLLESSVNLVRCCPGSPGVVESGVPLELGCSLGVVLGKGLPEINRGSTDSTFSETTAGRQVNRGSESESPRRRKIGRFVTRNADMTRHPVNERGFRQPRRNVKDVVSQPDVVP